MNVRLYQFEWDDIKAHANVRKHGISFELAATVFHDPQLLTVADLAHSESEERWFSVGCASNGVVLVVIYLWIETYTEMVRIRLFSARKATMAEMRQYEEGI